MDEGAGDNGPAAWHPWGPAPSFHVEHDGRKWWHDRTDPQFLDRLRDIIGGK